MKRLSMLLVGAALMTGGSALASAQPADHDGSRFEDRDRGRDRDRDRHFDRDHAYNGGRFDRDDRRFVRDRDDDRFYDRDDHRYFVGQRRFINGYYWNWDGHRWCRRDGRVVFYLNF